MDIVYSTHFAKTYKRLPRSVKISAEKKEKLFRENPFDKRLKTHKLHGKLTDLWSFSVDERHRIIFEFGEDVIYFHLIGNHGVYDL